MIYVKFDKDNKSVEMRTDPPADNAKDYIEVADDTLFGKRLIKTKNKVREFNQKELDAEAEELDRKYKAIVIDNTARKLLDASSDLVAPDFYEGLSEDKKAAVKQYRDALRNISKQEKYPEYVEFPDKPKVEE